MSSKDSVESQPADEKTGEKVVWISSFDEITGAYYYLPEKTVWDDRYIMESHNCLMWFFIILLCGFFITLCGSPLCLVMLS